MKNQLDEIKRLAASEIKKTHSFFKDGAPDIGARYILMTIPEYQLATHTLRLIKALEKCREQRDEHINSMERPGGPNIGRYKDLANEQLAKILEGRDE